LSFFIFLNIKYIYIYIYVIYTYKYILIHSISSALFREDSKYAFKNIKFNNINTNSKYLLYFLYSDVSFDNIEVANVTCNGGSGDSSLIFFDSGSSFKKITLNQVNIKKLYSNGSLIIIKGDSNQLSISNSNINEVKSYGSVIDNVSKKVKINFILSI